jgi:hypothetical protein
MSHNWGNFAHENRFVFAVVKIAPRISKRVAAIFSNEISLLKLSEFLTGTKLYGRIIDCVNFIQIDKQ